MKKITITLVLLISCSTFGFSQKLSKKVPANILESNSILLLSSEEGVEELSKYIIEDLATLGIKIIKTVEMDKNPSLRLKQYERLKEELKDLNIGNYISVDVIKYQWNSHTLGNIVREKLVTVFVAGSWNDLYGDVYLVKEKNYDKMFKKLESDINKQLK